MTKEEIVFEGNFTTHADEDGMGIELKDVYEAMDEYAKQVSIEFFKWYGVKMMGFMHYLIDIRATVTSDEIEEKIREHEGKSIEELYNQFIKHNPQ